MNLKTHKKGLIALALIFFMIMPMLTAINLVHATDTAAGSFSVYKSGTGGTTNVNSVTIPDSPNPIGTTISFDIYISGASNVWGWSIGSVTWNPAVMKLTGVTEGPWLQNNNGPNQATDFIGSSSSLWNNVAGDIGGGLSEAITADNIASTSAGVVTTLKFQIVGYGTSSLNIAGATLADTSEDANNQNPATSVSSATVTVTAPPLSISLYQSGTTTLNSLTISSTTNPIGDTFSVDAYIQGDVATMDLWGWNLGVTWNPAVLEMTGITQGSFLDQGVTGVTLFAPGSIDNVGGQIQGGVSDAYNTYTSSTAPAGVLMTMAFQVVGYGSANIALSTGIPSTLLNSAYPHQAITNPGSTPVGLNAFTYSWTAATATPPQAVIAVTGSPNNGNTYTNYPIGLDGSNSVPGANTSPPGQVCPITSYAWSITLVDGTVLTQTSSSPTFALTSDDIGPNLGSIVAVLTVTAPSPTNTPAGSYVDTATTTLTIQVNSPTTMIDIWTQNGGQGPYADASSFGPQQTVDLYAYVTYNGAPVVDKTVTFNVYLDGQYYSFTTAATDQSGLAIGSYRLPWEDSNPTQYFGEMTVSASVEIAQVTVSDSCNFYYGYQLALNSVVINNGATGGTGVGPVFNRYGMGTNTVEATVTVTNTEWNSVPFWLTGTIYDANNVPVAQCIVQETAPAAASGLWSNTQPNTYTIYLTIPTWAYVGQATLYVNIFSSDPRVSGTAFSPQQSAQLQIAAGYPSAVTTTMNTPTQVLNVQYNVQNDEDSGVSGYWAMDNYVKTVQVWSLGSNTYEVVATYKGTFTTYNNALSPQAGTPEVTGANGVTGTLYGEYVATFTAPSFNPNNLPAYGNLGTYNFGGTVADIQLQTYANQHYTPYGQATPAIGKPYDVFNAYFPGYGTSDYGPGTLDYVYWGWTYNLAPTSGSGTPSANSVWNNNAASNTGDIVVS